jgi:hypothetical protein
MSDWLDNFQVMGAKLNEGEKSLMRFAMRKERERIIELLDELAFQINSVEHNPAEAEGAYRALALIKGENK